jgi:two-component system sensor histidine kinase DegS
VTSKQKSLFAKRYQKALGLRLSCKPEEVRASPAIARELGETAVALQLGVVDLTRLHGRVFDAYLVQARPSPDALGATLLPPANQFLLDVLGPIGADQRAAPLRAAKVRRLGAVLLRRTAALAGLQNKLSLEVKLRRSGEKRLLKGAQRYNVLLLEARRLQSRSRRVAHQVLLAQEAERKEISRDLHDEVVQTLAGINVQLATLKETSAINSRSLRTRIGKTQRLVEQSVQIVHRYARKLRPAMLDDLGLIPALRAFARDLPGRTGLRIHLTASPEVESLDNARRTVLFRVAQEALTNVTRHAHAHNAIVRIQKMDDRVRLEVSDDGRSFSVERTMSSRSNKRLGLVGMRERMEMVGGTLAVVSSRGHGTRITAEIPFRTR